MDKEVLKEIRALRILLEISLKDIKIPLEDKIRKISKEIDTARATLAVAPLEDEQVYKELLATLIQEEENLLEYGSKYYFDR